MTTCLSYLRGHVAEYYGCMHSEGLGQGVKVYAQT